MLKFKNFINTEIIQTYFKNKITEKEVNEHKQFSCIEEICFHLMPENDEMEGDECTTQ